jgi:hypothetical protein
MEGHTMNYFAKFFTQPGTDASIPGELRDTDFDRLIENVADVCMAETVVAEILEQRGNVSLHCGVLDSSGRFCPREGFEAKNRHLERTARVSP